MELAEFGVSWAIGAAVVVAALESEALGMVSLTLWVHQRAGPITCVCVERIG